MIRSILASVKKADETFALIDPHDVIAIGISGGKDSMGLLLAMHLYAKFSKKDFRLVPICLDLGFPGFSVEAQKEYCASLGHELHVIDAQEVYPILVQHTKPGHHIPCSICSRMKKAAMNDAAKKLGCNKVAFAHHKDDALETLLMNMVHGGSVSTFEPKMRLDRAGIDFIRPFIFVEERQLSALVEEENIPAIGKTCPADGYTERQYCKDLLTSLYEQRPEAKTNFSSMLYDYESFRLYFNHVEYPNPFNPNLSLKPLLNAEDAIAYGAFAKEHGLSPLEPGQTHFLIQENHRPIGKISYVLSNPHQIDVLDLSCLDAAKAQDALLHFEDRMSRKINPLLFVYEGSSLREVALQCGYREGMPPLSHALTKRYQR